MTTIRDRQQKAFHSIAAMKPGEKAWIWMTASGPEGMPFFVVLPSADDPSGRSLAKRVRWLAGQTQTVATPIRGVLKRLSTGDLTLITSADPDLAAHTIAAAHADTPTLESITVVQARGRGFVATRRVDNVAAQAAAMRRIAADGRGWFCLVASDKQTELLLDTTADAIKARSAELRAEQPGARVVCGQLRCRNGRVEMRPRKSWSGLEDAVGRWGRSHSAWRDLAPLQSARIVA